MVSNFQNNAVFAVSGFVAENALRNLDACKFFRIGVILHWKNFRFEPEIWPIPFDYSWGNLNPQTPIFMHFSMFSSVSTSHRPPARALLGLEGWKAPDPHAIFESEWCFLGGWVKSKFFWPVYIFYKKLNCWSAPQKPHFLPRYSHFQLLGCVIPPPHFLPHVPFPEILP